MNNVSSVPPHLGNPLYRGYKDETWDSKGTMSLWQGGGGQRPPQSTAEQIKLISATEQALKKIERTAELSPQSL